MSDIFLGPEGVCTLYADWYCLQENHILGFRHVVVDSRKEGEGVTPSYNLCSAAFFK